MAGRFAFASLFLPVAAWAASCEPGWDMHGSRLHADCGALNLSSDDIKELAEKLQHMADDQGDTSTSMTLNLDHNAIGDAGAKLMASALSKHTALTSLSLQADGNSIGDEGIRALGAALGNLHNLNSLVVCIRYNQIGPGGLGDFGASLGRLKQLRILDLELRFNHVQSAGVGSLGRSLAVLGCVGCKLTSLTLDLYSNSIEDAGVSDLAGSLAAFTELTSLTMDLRYNKISDAVGRDLKAVLHSLEKLTSPTVDLPPAPPTITMQPNTRSETSTQDASALKASTMETFRSELAAMQHRKKTDGEPASIEAQKASVEALRAELTAMQQQQQQQHKNEERQAENPLGVSTTTTSFRGTTVIIDDGTATSPRTDQEVKKELEKIDHEAESHSGGQSVFFAVLAIGLLAVGLALGAQARGYDLAALLSTARDSVREFAASLPQARDYSMSLPEAGQTDVIAHEDTPSIVQPFQRTNDDFNPDLAVRVDMAAAKASSSRGTLDREVSFEDLINQNLTSMQASDHRME